MKRSKDQKMPTIESLTFTLGVCIGIMIGMLLLMLAMLYMATH